MRTEEPDRAAQGPADAQYLFLLELFVDHLAGERLAKLNRMFLVPTCVSFEFLGFKERDGIEVCPVDPMFEARAGLADGLVEYVYAGRSVMFALPEDTVLDKSLELVVRMLIRKRMPDGIKPDVFVGEGKLDLSAEFAALRKELLHCWRKTGPPPPAKVYQGEVPYGINGEGEDGRARSAGLLAVYVRLSGFGRTIVTEFEAPRMIRDALPAAGPSYVFKGEHRPDGERSPAVVYGCRPIDSPAVSASDLSRVCSDSRLEPPSSSGRRQAAAPIGEGCPAERPCGKALVLKLSGLLDDAGVGRKPRVTVAPEAAGGTAPEAGDSDHDVFVLRIGKKGLVGIDEKSDIQLEMRTPKGPERRPPVRYETREAQTDRESPRKDTAARRTGRKRNSRKKRRMRRMRRMWRKE